MAPDRRVRAGHARRAPRVFAARPKQDRLPAHPRQRGILKGSAVWLAIGKKASQPDGVFLMLLYSNRSLASCLSFLLTTGKEF